MKVRHGAKGPVERAIGKTLDDVKKSREDQLAKIRALTPRRGGLV